MFKTKEETEDVKKKIMLCFGDWMVLDIVNTLDDLVEDIKRRARKDAAEKYKGKIDMSREDFTDSFCAYIENKLQANIGGSK